MEIVINIKSAAFADDLTAIGMCRKLRQWWNYLFEEGPKIGYNPQPTKFWLIVKPQFEAKARQLSMGSNIQISTRGERHLGAVIGNTEFKQHYCQKLTSKMAGRAVHAVKNWNYSTTSCIYLLHEWVSIQVFILSTNYSRD